MLIKSKQQLRVMNSGKKPKVTEYWKAILGATDWTIGIFTTKGEAETECLRSPSILSTKKNRIEHYRMRQDGQWNYEGVQYIG